MHVDLDSGRATVRDEVDVEWNLPCHFYGHIPYSMLRGGGNALLHDGALLGTGHATATGYRHAPFTWTMDGQQRMEIRFHPLFSDFYNCGFNLIDPSSLFIDGEDLYLGLTCTECDWVHAQRVTNLLIAFRGSAPTGDYELLDEFLARRALPACSDGSALDNQLLFCVEMPSAVGYHQEHSGRVSIGEPGQLVGGPGTVIDSEGRYIAALSYVTPEHTAERAGVFDLMATLTDQQGELLEIASLGRAEIDPSPQETAELRVPFDTTGHVGWRLDTRVFVDADVRLNVYHIRTYLAHGRVRPVGAANPV